MARLSYREIISMCALSIPYDRISAACGCSAPKIATIKAAAIELGMLENLPPEFDDETLEALLDPFENFRCVQPSFWTIEKELGHKLGMKDANIAFDIYLKSTDADDAPRYVFNTFKVKFRLWLEQAHPAVVMHVNWAPMEEVQYDWAGTKGCIVNAEGIRIPAFLFVATLPYSGYTYVRASLDMNMQSWLEHAVGSFEFFKGAPLFIAIDNLRTGVTFGKKGRRINSRFEELAHYYGCEVVPAGIRRPTHKGACEGEVRIMANKFLELLAGREFNSINDLNIELEHLCEVYNDRILYRAGKTRRELYEEELKFATPLPKLPFEPTTIVNCKVSYDGVVRVRGNYYEVGESHADEKVVVRINTHIVSVYTKDKKRCLARYVRREDGSQTFEGYSALSPNRFRKLSDWARANDRLLMLEQWDYGKNGGLTPDDLVCGSVKAVWWKCPACGFSWKEQIVRRTRRSYDDCFVCAGIDLVKGVNDLATLYPEIAKEWGSKNVFDADEVFADSWQSVWWEGECGHTWRAPIVKRVRSKVGALCPYCTGHKVIPGVNDVATVAPEMAKLWHPSKNRKQTPENTPINYYFEVYLWDGIWERPYRVTPHAWLIQNGYADAVKDIDALIASARKADEENPWEQKPFECVPAHMAQLKWQRNNVRLGASGSLKSWCERFGREDLLEEWDYERNGDVTPDDVTRASVNKFWWRGKCGHAWYQEVRYRTYADGGCPYCARKRVLKGYSSVETSEVRLLKQWNEEGNTDIAPDAVSDRTHASIAWKCEKCGYEWSESMRNTYSKSRLCPACHKRLGFIVEGVNTLQSVAPKVAELFAKDLNPGLELSEVCVSAKRRVWWRGKCGHTWENRVNTQAENLKEPCSYCGGRKLLVGFNDLATVASDVAKQWDYELNSLKPTEVLARTNRKAYWKCERGHSWVSPIAQMVDGRTCPYCANRMLARGFNDLATKAPEVAALWDYERNGVLRPSDVLVNGSDLVWWIHPECGHSFQRYVRFMVTEKRTCPYCTFKILLPGVNDLATTHPKVAREWARDLNGKLRPKDIMRSSGNLYWWRGKKCGHTWQATPRQRTAHEDVGCPYCKNRKLLAGFNDLQTKRPDLALQWHSTNNKKLKPADVLYVSSKEVWWQHPECGHVWKAAPAMRKSDKCPYCMHRRRPERKINWEDELR